MSLIQMIKLLAKTFRESRWGNWYLNLGFLSMFWINTLITTALIGLMITAVRIDLWLIDLWLLARL